MSDKHFQRAYSSHMAGDREVARALYQKILMKQPKHVDARYMLGTLLAESGEIQLALTHLKAAASRMPNSPMIHTNLGNVYLRLGKLDHAGECYKRAIKLDPLVPETLFNLGVILYRQGKLDEAASCIESSLEIKPDFHEAYMELSRIYREQNEHELAAACFIKLLAIKPDKIEALFELGNLYAAAGDQAKATFYFKRALEIEPGNESARHALAALSGHTPATAPRSHVEKLFNDMAQEFEQHLVNLGYRAPEILREMVIKLTDDKVCFDRSIDLGCGTGLSGLQFRPMVKHFTGIDLSQMMVDQAQAKGIYDELVKGDVSQYLDSSQHEYDLFVATDVFVYIGELSDVFSKVRAHAKPGACFVFSTEAEPEQDYILRPTGRYAHSRKYIEALADKYGFVIAASQTTNLRKEGQQQIIGELYVLKLDKPG